MPNSMSNKPGFYDETGTANDKKLSGNVSKKPSSNPAATNDSSNKYVLRKP